MATRHLLADLGAGFAARYPAQVTFRSAGGVEVAQWVRNGEAADVVVLSETAIKALAAEKLLVADSVADVFVSDVVAAVPEGAPDRAISTQVELHDALSSASAIAYSTGPSGTAVLSLIECWGLTSELTGRLIQAPPGVPVGALLAHGDADLGFQQRSELSGVVGVRILGPLPGEAAIKSVFSAAMHMQTRHRDESLQLIRYLSSPAAANTVTAHGMTLAGC
jgi:molybdate transport system substrate-binding protein